MERSLIELKEEILTIVTGRFERRLSQELSAVRREIQDGDGALRKEMHEGFGLLRKDMADQRVELLRWSFLFWLGQVAAMAAMFNVMLRALER